MSSSLISKAALLDAVQKHIINIVIIADICYTNAHINRALEVNDIFIRSVISYKLHEHKKIIENYCDHSKNRAIVTILKIRDQKFNYAESEMITL